MTQTYYEKIRIYPNVRQEKLLLKYLDICRGLYNNVIYKQRMALQAYASVYNTGIFDEEKEFPQAKIEGQLLTAKRKHSARISSVLQEFEAGTLKRAFNAVKIRKTGAKLRFKNQGTFKTIKMSHADRAVKFSPNGEKFKFNKEIGMLSLKHGRKIPENFTTISITIKNNKWYAAFNCQRNFVALAKTRQNVGIDLGITNIIATSEGVLIQNPRYIEKKQAIIANLQQLLAKGNYKDSHLKRAIARLRDKVLNQSRDFQHKLALTIVNANDVIVLENLNLDKMKTNGNKTQRKGLQNVAPARLVKYICDKAESAGRSVYFVNPAYTSQDCSGCGFRDANNRNGEMFCCLKCGFKGHADINAACNILKKGLVEAGVLATKPLARA